MYVPVGEGQGAGWGRGNCLYSQVVSIINVCVLKLFCRYRLKRVGFHKFVLSHLCYD